MSKPKAEIHIEAANAAFDGEDAGHELARILRGIANRIEAGDFPSGVDGMDDNFVMCLRDINGNSVGTFAWSGREPG